MGWRSALAAGTSSDEEPTEIGDDRFRLLFRDEVTARQRFAGDTPFRRRPPSRENVPQPADRFSAPQSASSGALIL